LALNRFGARIPWILSLIVLGAVWYAAMSGAWVSDLLENESAIAAYAEQVIVAATDGALEYDSDCPCPLELTNIDCDDGVCSMAVLQKDTPSLAACTAADPDISLSDRDGRRFKPDMDPPRPIV